MWPYYALAVALLFLGLLLLLRAERAYERELRARRARSRIRDGGTLRLP